MTRNYSYWLKLCELYYPFMISTHNGSYNSVDDLSTKVCLLSKTNDLNVKVFNMILGIDCKCKFDSTTCKSDQRCNNETCQCGYKKSFWYKKYCRWKPSTCIWE